MEELNKMKKKIIRKKGILFWVTGLSGSGKTTLSKKILKEVIKSYGPTLLISGDDLREIFSFNRFTEKERKLLAKKYCKYAKFITSQNINLIFAAVGMFNSTRAWYRKNIDNYIEIYIKADLQNIIKLKKKKIYHKKNIGDIVGINIKPEFPQNPHIIINNDFKKNSNVVAKELFSKIKKII